MTAIRVRAGDVELLADLYDTPTAETLAMMLPLSGRGARWGDEFYFRIEAMMADKEPDARDVLEVGEIGFWVEGQAVAIFFGPTPASREDEPRAVVPVNVIGKIRDHADSLRRLEDGVWFVLEAAD